MDQYTYKRNHDNRLLGTTQVKKENSERVSSARRAQQRRHIQQSLLDGKNACRCSSVISVSSSPGENAANSCLNSSRSGVFSRSIAAEDNATKHNSNGWAPRRNKATETNLEDRNDKMGNLSACSRSHICTVSGNAMNSFQTVSCVPESKSERKCRQPNQKISFQNKAKYLKRE